MYYLKLSKEIIKSHSRSIPSGGLAWLPETTGTFFIGWKFIQRWSLLAEICVNFEYLPFQMVIAFNH